MYTDWTCHLKGGEDSEGKRVFQASGHLFKQEKSS